MLGRLSLLSLLIFAHPAFAGSIQSGGGESFSDRLNPWFVHNTTVVRYCIEIDEETFGASRDQAEKQVERAVAFWKKELSDPISPPAQTFSFRIGNQQFTQVPCAQSHEVKFQFGVLSETQKAFLQNPNQYIGVAIRDEYDAVSLRAKGYIYISPASGPLKYQGPSLIENAWALHDGLLLANVLAHELGHVFGFPHHGGPLELMGQQYLEQLLDKDYAQWLSSDDPIPAVVSLTTGQDKPICIGLPGMNEIGQFFGIPGNWRCLRIKYHHQSVTGASELKVFASEGKNDPEVLVAEAVLKTIDTVTFTHGVSLWVTSKQSLFPLSGSAGIQLSGPQYPRVVKQGTLSCLQRDCTREVFARFESGTAFVGGVLDGKLVYDLFRPTANH